MADPRELEDGNEIDRDDAAIDVEDVPYEKLMKMLTAGDDAEGEDIAFGAGKIVEAKPADVVSVDDGLDLIDKAASTRRESAKVAAPEGEDTQPAADGADSVAGEAAADASPAPAPAADDLDTLLDGIADDRKEAIRGRVKAADDVMSIFTGREAELERHGVSPQQAMNRLIELNAYATKNPTDYIAWAAMQLGNPHEVIGAAAAKLGLKLAPATGDEDAFEDPAIKEKMARLAAYEARDLAAGIGPDAPVSRAQSELETFASRSPHWQSVAPQVAALAKTHHETTGRPVTITEIERFYSASLLAAGIQQEPAPQAQPAAAITPAAQSQQPVAQGAQTTTAATSDSVQRAKAASKSLDGSGQGAGRRPALDPDASVKDVLTSLWGRSGS